MAAVQGVPTPTNIGGEFYLMASAFGNIAKTNPELAFWVIMMTAVEYLVQRDGYFVLHVDGCDCQDKH
jgi:hypothetical protein